jgi:hypothetical protein
MNGASSGIAARHAVFSALTADGSRLQVASHCHNGWVSLRKAPGGRVQSVQPANLRFVTGSPGQPFDVSSEVAEALGGPPGDRGAQFAFAYASMEGVNAVLAPFKSSIGHGSTTYKWIIGVHGGISEPRALTYLSQMERSSVRIFTGTKRLRAESLTTDPRLHAKVISVANTQGQYGLLLASSANATGAAMGDHPRNWEAGIAATSTISGVTTDALRDWWARLWRNSLPATAELVGQYAALREAYVARNPDSLAELEPPIGLDAAKATTLWIESGKMSGGSRNQVEFSTELASFFVSPPTNKSVQLTIRHKGGVWDDRPLSPKTTTLGVEIFRLSLPSSSNGGPEYPGKIIRFDRLPGVRRFRLDVAEMGSTKASRWGKLTHEMGLVHQTGGGRMFGIC